MGKRGPKPKPTALRKFEGVDKRGVPTEDDVQPALLAKVPPAPEMFTGMGRDVWDDLAPTLHQIGLLTVSDLHSFTLYCAAWEEWGEAEKEIRENGLLCISEKGAKYQNPAVGIRHQAWAVISRESKNFGLNPSSRVGLNLGGGKKRGDKLDEFLEG